MAAWSTAASCVLRPTEPVAKRSPIPGGRPLGLHFDAAGNLIVADAAKGLLSIAPDGAITVLATEAAGVPFGFTDDVDIGADGTIYFSDASAKFGYEDSIADVFEHRGNGRLLAYDPVKKTARVLLDGLYFANGVAVGPDQRFVLVAETGSYRIKRYWLAGAKAGTAEIFIDNLPGFPDGVSSNGSGIFWVAIFAPRNPAADVLAGSPFLRKVVWRLPDALRPKPERYSFLLGLDLEGRVVANLQDPDGSYAPITSVEQHGAVLYLGSLTEPAIGRIAAPR
jgi:sugar lactone lactonase YvrE